MDPDEVTRHLARAAREEGRPTAWFERLYTAADEGAAIVPWDRGTPNPLVVQWLDPWVEQRRRDGLPVEELQAVVVGAGYGRDSEYVAGLGFTTTGFDISPAAVAATRRRFPDSPVDYVVADLFDLPPAWHRGFDLVVESFTVQALPDPPRSAAVAAVSSLVAPGGTLLVVLSAHDGQPRHGTRSTCHPGRCCGRRWRRYGVSWPQHRAGWPGDHRGRSPTLRPTQRLIRGGQSRLEGSGRTRIGVCRNTHPQYG